MAHAFDRLRNYSIRTSARNLAAQLHKQAVRDVEKELERRVRYAEISDVVEYEYRAEEVDGRLREGPCFVRFFPKVSGTIKIYYKTLGKQIGRVKDVIRVDDRNKKRIYEKFKGLRADQFVVTVGVLDEEETHEGVTSESSMTYKALFALLKELGYDPLFLIRQQNYIDTIEKKLGNIFLKSINKKKPDDTRSIKTRMAGVARDIVDYVKDYIAGGNKPPLKESTVYQRHWKSGRYGVEYPNGIDEPLSESGQIENAIKFNISAFRSSGRLEYWEEKKERGKKQKQRKKEKNKELPPLSAKAAMDEIDRFFDELNKELARREKAKETYDFSYLENKPLQKQSVLQHDANIKSLINQAKYFIKDRGRNADEDWKLSVDKLDFDKIILDFGGKL